MANNFAFFLRSCPQAADIASITLTSSRVFIAAEMDYAGPAVKDGGSAQEAYREAVRDNCTAERVGWHSTPRYAPTASGIPRL